jgi:Protein of unknown function (DUF1360)
MILMWAILLGLAAFRLYRIAGVDSITEPIHGRLNASHHPVARWFSELVGCPWCIGFWASVALAAVGAWVGMFTWPEAVPVALAASTVCGLTASIDNRLQA